MTAGQPSVSWNISEEREYFLEQGLDPWHGNAPLLYHIVKTNSWKTADLAGCEVLTEDGERLGVMQDVLPSAANDVWVVKGDTPRLPELLIPALRSVVLDVDLERKKIVVSLPPGLRAVYETEDPGNTQP